MLRLHGADPDLSATLLRRERDGVEDRMPSAPAEPGDASPPIQTAAAHATKGGSTVILPVWLELRVRSVPNLRG